MPAPSSSTTQSDARPRIWWSRRSRVLLALFLLLIPAFAVTAFTTQAYRRQQQQVAAASFTNGERALRAGHAAVAVSELRTAMSLAPTRTRRLRLAQALAAAGRGAEARAHLLTLRDAAPGDGVINLELARLAARTGDVPEATRYYRDAVEGAWATAPDAQRREARLELADLLVHRGTPGQAEAELIAVAADLPPDAALHVRVGDLLLQSQQVRRAFDVYAAALQMNPANTRAEQGAAESAFRLGNYVTARRYFAAVAAAEPGNTYVGGRLETVNAVIALDPYRRGLPARERAARAVLAHQAARERLTLCAESHGLLGATATPAGVVGSRPDPGTAPAASGLVSPGSAASAEADELQRLAADMHAMAPRVTVRAMLRDSDLLDEVMNVVFRVEDACEVRCGDSARSADEALLLIARDQRTAER